MMTSKQPTSPDTKDKSTSLPEDFLASPSAFQENEEDQRMTAISGRICFEQSSKSGPVGLLLKMLPRLAGFTTHLTGMVFPPQVTQVESEASDQGQEIHRTLEAAGILDRICGDLEALEYDVQPIIIPACSVSAPHRRDRVFIFAHAYQKRGQRGKHHREERSVQGHKERDAEKTQSARQQQQPHVGQDCRAGVTANAAFEGLEGTSKQRISQTSGRGGESEAQFHFTAWIRSRVQATTDGGGGNFFESFPTEPPICGRDDGIPSNLDGITISKLRKESLKGYGNAVVVPLVVEIFKAIEAVEKADQ